MKLPSFQFYPGDWIKDPNLRRCSHAAKGVWIDLLCLLFENEERGVLATAGRAWSDDEVAWAVGGDRAVVLACIQELTLKGVVNRQSNGALYSKRLVRDEHKRMLCIEAGKRGGNPNLQRKVKGDPKGLSNGGANPDPTPSSSSSSSSSDIPPISPKGFDEFWRQYPVKVGKGAAIVFWRKEKPPLEPILTALNWQKKSKRWREGFVPNPLTYLRQKRWLDEPGGESNDGGHAPGTPEDIYRNNNPNGLSLNEIKQKMKGE